MGRCSSFNKQQVLADALDLFWSRGFSASSLKHLEEVTDMHPGSLYYHFNSKEQLYVATLEHYIEWFLQLRIDKHLIYGTSRDNLRRFFTTGYRHGDDYRFRNCCFIISTSIDLHLLPETASELVRNNLNQLRQAFIIFLKNASTIHLPSKASIQEQVADELLNLYLSMQLRAGMNPNQRELDKQVKQSLERILPIGS